MKRMIGLSAAALLMAGAAFPAAAQETEAPGQPFVHPADDASYAKDMRSDEALAKSKPTDNGKVRYVSGGIAASGMRAIDAEESLYNLKLLFVREPSGEYLANVGVDIRGKDGEMLHAATRGPVLLAKMKPGEYTVTAQTPNGGQTLTRRVEAGKDHLDTYVFRFQPRK